MEQKLRLVNQDLRAFNLETYQGPIRPSCFGTQFGPQQTVDVVFTSDRSAPQWAQEDSNAGGFLEKFAFEEGVSASASIYVLATPPAPESPAFPGRKRWDEPILSVATGVGTRELVMRLLVHELAHVRQAWMLPRDFDTQYKNAGPYNGNIFETAAFSFADRFVTQYRARINQGLFDKYLPKWITDAKKPAAP